MIILVKVYYIEISTVFRWHQFIPKGISKKSEKIQSLSTRRLKVKWGFVVDKTANKNTKQKTKQNKKT